jgi:hypothetical protein
MRVRRPLLAAAVAGTVAIGLSLAGPVSASPPGELAPGAHPAANVNASDRVVYQYDRSESAARAARPSGGGGQSPLMTYHGGKILVSTVTHAIFWGPTWATAPGDKITGMDDWYHGFGGSNYAATNTEYDGVGGQVTSASTYTGHEVDLSTASGGQNSSAILTEVSRVLAAHSIAPDPSGYYPVYTDLPRGHASYCAWHSSGLIGSTTVQFAFFWKLDGDPGCDPQDTTNGHSPGLAAIANVSGHELSEAMTDPASPGAWYDSKGAENGDKCAWTFGGETVTFSNGTHWKIQGEWSNKAYSSGSGGYPNSAGQKGCLGGL